MKWIQFTCGLVVSLFGVGMQINACGQNQIQIAAAASSTKAGPRVETNLPPASARPASAEGFSADTAPSYVLCASDILQVKVYQEDDLETKLRINRDGTAIFPLIGVINLGGKTVEQAAALIRDELGKDYLVNPQITVTVVEYAKRRFTVLGQVQRPGTYEIPNEESVTFLQAVAMAGGYTRLANRSNVTVTRSVNGRKTALSLDLNHAAADPNTPEFIIQSDDIITVSERIF
jgi:protein involved in polysaccharide export with SLBB domain